MKILWVTNLILPEAMKIMDLGSNPFGGWLVNSSKHLAKSSNISLSIASPMSSIDNIRQIQGENIKYYIFPWNKNKKRNRTEIEKLILEVKPDIVHIHGTEYNHVNDFMDLCIKHNIKYVISIQGMTSYVARHFDSDLPNKVKYGFTFRDFIRLDNIYFQKVKYARRGKLERNVISKSKYIIGRTTIDRSYVEMTNPAANYFLCNETLRENFYKNEWTYEKCAKETIFMSQGSYPFKGLHILLEAIYIIKNEYPKVKLYISGPNFTTKPIYKISMYEKYILKLIKEYELQSNIKFVGLLDEKMMIKHYLQSHVFVLSSAIENSPNSMGEAMILGVPVVSSFVGGVPDLVRHLDSGLLYPYNAPYLLAYHLLELFRDDSLCIKLSKNARILARDTHNESANNDALINIYERILNRR